MKKIFFIFLFLSVLFISSPAFAGENPTIHKIGWITQASGYLDNTVFAKEKFWLVFRENVGGTSFTQRLGVAVVDLSGTLLEKKYFIGNSQNKGIDRVSSSSDGTSCAFVFIEKDSSEIPHVYAVTTTDCATYRVREVASGLKISNADVAVYGNTVIVVYREGSKLEARKSTDGGNTFQFLQTVYDRTDPLDQPFAFDLTVSQNGKLGLVIATMEHNLTDSGDDIWITKIYYFEGNVSSGFGSPTLIYSGGDDEPDNLAIWNGVSVAFDNFNNPWVAWISKNQKILWRNRSGSIWGSVGYFFTPLEVLSSSIKLVKNKAYNGPGVIFLYTKGSPTGVYYRYSTSSNSLSSEKVFQAAGSQNIGFISATDYFGRFAVTTIGYPQNNLYSLNLTFDELLVPGRTGKFRYKLWSEDFESSDVLSDPYWTVQDLSGVSCYFKEAQTYKYSGLRSLWSAGYGNLNGKYKPNTNTAAYLNFYTPVRLNFELEFFYSFANADDPLDVASGGFSSFPITLPATSGDSVLWDRKNIFSSGSENKAVFRMIADTNSNVSLGLFVDNLNLFGYKLGRPSIQGISELPGRIEFSVTGFDGKKISLYRASYGSESFSLVAESTSSLIKDSPPPGTYSYYVVVDDGFYESPPSELKTKGWSQSVASSDSFERFSGRDRYLTAVELSKRHFNRANNVVIATGENFPDALSAAPLARLVGAPILLVKSTGIPAEVLQEVERLGAQKAYIVGGTGVVPQGVEETLRNAGLSIERIAGRDRYETAVNIALKIIQILGSTNFDRVYIATGENYPDALSISPVAAYEVSPILLVKKDAIPQVVANLLNNIGAKNSVVVGGEGVVSANVFNQLTNARRISGANRYETSVQIAKFAYGILDFSKEGIYLATGGNFPDALSAGVYAGINKQALLLVNTNLPLRYETEQFLSSYKIIKKLNVIGGEGAVSSQVVSRILSLIR